MQIASYIVAAIGTIGLAVGQIFYSSNKTFSIWTFFGSSVLLMLGGAMYWQNLVWKQATPEEPTHGFLLPANDPMPENPCGQFPASALALYLGNSVAYATSFPYTVLRVDRHDRFSIDRTTDGVSVSLDVFSDDGKIVAEISKNEFTINPNNFFKRERPDKHTLIVYDQKKQKVLSIRYLNQSAVKILGIFYYPNRPPIVIEEQRQRIEGNNFSGFCLGDNKKGAINIGPE